MIQFLNVIWIANNFAQYSDDLHIHLILNILIPNGQLFDTVGIWILTIWILETFHVGNRRIRWHSCVGTRHEGVTQIKQMNYIQVRIHVFGIMTVGQKTYCLPRALNGPCNVTEREGIYLLTTQMHEVKGTNAWHGGKFRRIGVPTLITRLCTTNVLNTSNSTHLIFAILDHYLSISNVFKYCSSRVINPNSTWYLTPIKAEYRDPVELFAKVCMEGSLKESVFKIKNLVRGAITWFPISLSDLFFRLN